MIQYGRNAIVLAIDQEGSRTDQGAVDVAINAAKPESTMNLANRFSKQASMGLS
jgi:hypothetical protein